MPEQTLSGKSALITGAGTGVGRATALRLAREGANVVVNYSRSADEAENTCREVEANGGRALPIKCDVSREKEVRQMVSNATRTFGGIDILVNNAGVTDFVAIDDLDGLTDHYWDRAFNVNARGLFYCARAAAPELKKSHGVIINITSAAGLSGQGSSIAYAASKAAAICLTQSLALALAPEVRVNGIAPGIIMTRWNEGRTEHIERFSKNTPLGRTATADDIAEIVYAFAVHMPHVTGRNIVVDGGAFL